MFEPRERSTASGDLLRNGPRVGIRARPYISKSIDLDMLYDIGAGDSVVHSPARLLLWKENAKNVGGC